MKKYQNLKGKKLGYCTIINLSEDKFDSNKTTKLWECQCECGAIFYLSARIINQYIKNNTKVSCGCHQYKNYIKKTFGDFLVLEQIEKYSKTRNRLWKCQCIKCGKIIQRNSRQLEMNLNKCEKELLKNALLKKEILRVFNSMKSRCYNLKNKSYKNYGGRGITICDEWLENSAKFVEWSLKNGYKKELSIDRIDVNGNYEPSNCRWVDWETQCNNKRNTLLIEYNGKKQSLKKWCEELNLPYRKTHKRIYLYKWGIEKSFKTK